MVDIGLTVIELPLPALVPLHEPVYHCHVAPVPNEPPTTESVVGLPVQVVTSPLIPVAATESVFTVTVVLAQVVVLQFPE